MGAQGSIEKNLSDYKNSERMGVYRQFEENDRNLIEISHRVPNEAAFKQWAAEVEEIKNKNELSQSIYLPEKSYFKPTGLCGSSGTLHVSFDLFRSSSKDGKASSGKKSPAVAKINTITHKKNFGSFCSVSVNSESYTRPWEPKLATFIPTTSSSLLKVF